MMNLAAGIVCLIGGDDLALAQPTCRWNLASTASDRRHYRVRSNPSSDVDHGCLVVNPATGDGAGAQAILSEPR